MLTPSGAMHDDVPLPDPLTRAGACPWERGYVVFDASGGASRIAA